ncbi:FHA domain protein [Actinomadura rubteroloni]|uniref:FHA domain protein n=1 Tax=Actinomadura rubteroloni TaxID=1926885 RepID=A0A2P4UHG2_9ACTN|nr:FHA domain-containing protein [Actinomadura rubteroloni]POM24497.1 FHA domain protein [Actinomadura rubteroloni]
MAVCPAGHTSAAADYCDVCGELIGAAPARAPVCPDCGTPGVDRFCEACGYDFATGRGAPTRTAGWVAVVAADPAYFATVRAGDGPDTGGLAFPSHAPERTIPLTGPEVRIGRRGGSDTPEIDLREPPGDPGVSRRHAVLLARPGGWTLVDRGSTNRTCVNGSADPVPFHAEVPVGDGDRIHVGAWTTITLREIR